MNALRIFLITNPQVTLLTLEHCGMFNEMHVPLLMLLGADDARLQSWTPYSSPQCDLTAFDHDDGLLPALDELIVVREEPSGSVQHQPSYQARSEWRVALQKEVEQRRPNLRVVVVNEREWR